MNISKNLSFNGRWSKKLSEPLAQSKMRDLALVKHVETGKEVGIYFDTKEKEFVVVNDNESGTHLALAKKEKGMD